MRREYDPTHPNLGFYIQLRFPFSHGAHVGCLNLPIMYNTYVFFQNVKEFLDESNNGFIYVSFGSMVRIETFPKPILDAFYGSFKSIAPVRVLMKITKPDDLPPGLPSNVITHTWLPQIKVLSVYYKINLTL